MPCPTLEQLPPPPPGQTGWPWTEAPPVLPDALPDGQPWPRISLVTPTYNQARWLEGTIRSVLLQGYPNLEYIVINDGSTDETASILEKYGPFLTHWETQANRGQSYSINKGLARSTGVIFNWLNSDDQLVPGALAEVARLWQESPASILVGACSQVDPAGQEIRHWPPQFPQKFVYFFAHRDYAVAQPSAFLDCALTRKVGGVRDNLRCVMDWELYLRLLLEMPEEVKVVTTPRLLSRALYHPACKTAALGHIFRREVIDVLAANCHRLPLLDRLRVRHTLARLRAQEALFGEGRGERPGMRTLLALAVKQPSILSTRYFWGSVRRSLVSPQPQPSA